MSSAIRQQRWRERKIAEIGLEAFRTEQARKSRERRARTKLAEEKSNPNKKLILQLIAHVKAIKIDKEKVIPRANMNIDEFLSGKSCEEVIDIMYDK